MRRHSLRLILNRQRLMPNNEKGGFYRTLPFIVELRARAGENKSGEIETCFNALYGILLLRMQHKEISKQTLEAVTQITKFVSTLAHYYHKDKIFPLFDKEDYDNL